MTVADLTGQPRRGAPRSQEQRLDDLLRAGVDAFREVGWDATTVADITTRAGVAKGTFYLYFRTKEQLVGVLWERYVEGFLTTASDILGGDRPGRDWPGLFDDCIDRLVRHALDHAELHRMVYGSANGHAIELCRQANERAIRVLADALARAVEDGQLAVRTPGDATRFVYHGVHGLVGDVIAGRADAGGDDAEEVVARAKELVHRVLDLPPSAGQRRTDDLG